MARIVRYLVFSILLISASSVLMPRGFATGAGVPTVIYLYSQPPFTCAVSTFSTALPAGSLLNIDMFSDQTIYLYLMTPEGYSNWSYRHQCNSPGLDILLYVTIPRDFGYTLHWSTPSNGTYYFVFEYDSRYPPSATVNLIDHSSVPTRG